MFRGDHMTIGSEITRSTEPSAASLWCVLRTSGRSTMRLADSLAAIGIEAWTPREVASVRRGFRARKRVDVDQAMLPSFVFADARWVDVLAMIAVDPVSPHPAFSLFRHLDRYPLVNNAGLGPLRRLEQSRRTQRALRAKANLHAKGDRVKLTEGSFAGMHGVVEQAGGGFAMVAFPGWNMPIKIASFHLVSDVQHDVPTVHLDVAA
jgi:hypothetical protein